ncbi:MAG: efflux RND transporter periplasmic adaptor subunit [Pseudomonas sp.]|uniref:efflux RND transporter periplasmic adaptor subunit n=1 Tax=Pseudomonas sp. TaxID=306 RepID=UPI00273549CA|nr:efflux RND transporter periplasmic adaptor subunit [Pseudomonas sp.]MDP3846445.1 efflux RND transporter periplasmic adaptor subunit [Pseudomonas sp.]
MLRRRLLTMLSVVTLVVLALAAAKFVSIYQQIQQFSAPPPLIAVSATTASEQLWQSRLPAIGSLKAFQGVDLTVEAAGTVKHLAFRSGEKVSLNQPLLQLDSVVEQASLATEQAELALAQVEHERGKNLLARQALSKSEYDRLSAELQKSITRVAQLNALLERKRIIAPFAGTIGIRQVDVGDFVTSGTTVATLQDLSKLFVDFYLPEQNVPQLALGQQVRISVAAYPGEVFIGEITAINPKVEVSTRNLQVRALLANPDAKLLPGMFANLQVLLASQAKQVVVPETAITFTLYGNSLYVVGPKEQPAASNPCTSSAGQLLCWLGLAKAPEAVEPQQSLVVERRFVSTGERRDGLVIISKGLRAGEQIVTAGQLKLDNGASVSLVADQATTPAPASPSAAN